jgi:tetratricopeptide (TPR) repeat protein
LPAGELDLREDRAFLLANQGWLLYDRDRLAAGDCFAQALELYRALDDRAGTAECLLGLGMVAWARGRLDEAARQLEASLEISQELDDRRGATGALNNLALVRKHQGRHEEAESLHRQVVESYQLLGSRREVMFATNNLAHTLAEVGRYEEMLATARRAIALAHEMGGPDSSFAQAVVGRSLQHLGRYQEAQALLRAAATSARETGDRQNDGLALNWLGEIALGAGDYDQAEKLFAESETVLAKLQQNVLAIPIAWLSHIYRLQGDADRAGRQLGRALHHALDGRSVLSFRHCLPVAALLVADRGDLVGAAELHALSQTFPAIASSRWFHGVTGRELDAIVARLPAEVAAAAMERGRALDLWATAEALSAELSQD